MRGEERRITRGAARKGGSALILLSIGLIVSGTKACQEDYALGSQVSVNKTTTPTPTATDEGGGGSATATPTTTPGVLGSVTPSPTPTGTKDTAGLTNGGVRGGASGSLYQELSALSNESPSEVAAAVAKQGKSGGRDANWLGESFRGQKSGGAGEWQDRDGDGFSDATEQKADTDPSNAGSAPEWILSSTLDKRVKGRDSDMDGLLNSEEAAIGSDPRLIDTDGDGRTDGAEKRSGGDPRSPNDTYLDSDSDGLSDEYEMDAGLNPRSLDSDSDGLRDDTELAIGSDPLKVDTDNDGVADGKEFDLGADPVVADGK